MATEFICTINKTGEDYGTLTSWESAVQADLTSSATKVFAHGGITGTIADAASVTGATSGATATVAHCSTSQIMLTSISGTFQSGEQIEVDASNYVTSADAGDSVIAVVECYDDDGALSDNNIRLDGWTTNITNYIKVTVPEGDRHSGVLPDGTTGDGFIIQAVSPSADYGILATLEDYTIIEWLTVKMTSLSNYQDRRFGISIKGEGNCTIRNSIVVYTGGTTLTGADSNSGIAVIQGADGHADVNYVYDNIVYGFHNTTTNNWFGIVYVGLGSSPAASTITYFYNNTIYNCDKGVYWSEGHVMQNPTVYVKNNISISSNNICFGSSGAFTEYVDYNASSDATATGANSISTASTTDLVDTTSGSEILLLASGAVEIDIGTDLGSDYQTDITGKDQEIRTTAWSIGAHQFTREVGWWKCDDDDSNVNTIDSVGGMTGEASQNTSLFNSTAILTNPTASYYYNSQGERVLVPTDPRINDMFDNGATLAFQIKMVNPGSISSTSYAFLLSKGSDTNAAGWSLIWWDDNTVSLYSVYTTGSNVWKLNTALSRDTAYHMVIAYDKSDLTNEPTWWINGVEVAFTKTSTGSGTPDSDAARDFKFNHGSTRTGLMYMNDVRVIPELVDQDDVDELYASGAGLATPLTYSTSSVETAIVTPVTTSFSIPNVTASYVQIETVTVTPVTSTYTIPNSTATYVQIETSITAPVLLTLSILEVTATYNTGAVTVEVEPVEILCTVLEVLATYTYVVASTVEPVTVALTLPSVTASSSDIPLQSQDLVATINLTNSLTATINLTNDLEIDVTDFIAY